MSFEKDSSVASISSSGRLVRKILAGAALAAILPVLHTASASAAIADLYGDPTATGSVAGVYTETGTVTAVLDVFTSKGSTSNTFTLEDSTGSALFYSIPETSYTATVGDNVTITATNSPYQNGPEMTRTAFTETKNSTGNAVVPLLTTIGQVLGSGNGLYPLPGPPIISEAIVTLDNVTFPSDPASLVAGTKAATSSYTISDGTNSMTLFAYSSESNIAAAVAAANTANPGGYGGTYDITGYVAPFFGTPEIYPLSITAVPEPVAMGVLAFAGMSLLARRRRTGLAK